jgi:BirA family biotin operon repressor/biotin-[acetyl-CoA-carboxylase] ligase
MSETELSPAAILAGLETTTLPRAVLWYPQVGSTMDIAREQVRTATELELPLLVLTDEQIAGRGRSGRPWAAPPGTALLFSLAFRPTWLAPADAPLLTWMACVALCEGITAAMGLQPRLKWPNDLLLIPAESAATPATEQETSSGTATGRKIAGVLVELSSVEQTVTWAIIGCGLNVSASPPPTLPLRYPATDLSAALGRPVARLPLLRSILLRLDYWYTLLQAGERASLFSAWRHLLITIGQTVQVTTAAGTLRGVVEAVEASGALRLRDEAGNIHIVASGDVG